jgi:N-acetylglucosamine malate deacetylase 1
MGNWQKNHAYLAKLAPNTAAECFSTALAPASPRGVAAIWDVKRILVLAPHTDDYELGAGGTISRLMDSGADLSCAIFSTCDKSIPKGFPKDCLLHESRAAAAVLGLAQDKLQIFDFPVREFPSHRQEILEHLVRFRDEFRPNLVLVNSGSDIHQDHQILHNEAVRAFRETTVLGYELPWNMIDFSSKALVALEPVHIELKKMALSAYKSQMHRKYFNREFINSWAQVRGVTIGAEFAEAFEVVRLVVR